MYGDLGTIFSTSEREEFEDALTDIQDFEPFMEAMVTWRIAEIEFKENEQQKLDEA